MITITKHCIVSLFFCLLTFCVVCSANAQQGGFFSRSLVNYHEQECVRKGWQKGNVTVAEKKRLVLWKGPHGFWSHGAIILLHGDGGSYSNFCSNINAERAMVEFANSAIKEGFAVFSLESLDGEFQGIKGKPCQKRFDSFGNHVATNLDLPFIGKIITKTIPKLRPVGSKQDIFIAGISNGGFMAVMAAANYANFIKGFAVISAGDPYGTHIDCGKEPLRGKGLAGVYIDNETSKPLSEEGACTTSAYRREFLWPVSKLRYNPPFKLFYNEGDPIIHSSCKEKLHRILVSNRFEDAGSFVLPMKGWNRASNHGWLKHYNKPMIDFFKELTRPANSRARDFMQNSR